MAAAPGPPEVGEQTGGERVRPATGGGYVQHSDLLLPPRLLPSWRTGCGVASLADLKGQCPQGSLVLSVRPGDYTPFASFHSAAVQVTRTRPPGGAATSLRVAMDELSWSNVGQADGEDSLESAILRHRGVLAALRRVSRESAQLCSRIHRAAIAFLSALERLDPAPARVIVPAAGRLDRPSLKVFGRCTLLAAAERSPRWEWWFEGPLPDQEPECDGTADDLWNWSRSGIFAALRSVLHPKLAGPERRMGGRAAFAVPSRLQGRLTDACGWLGQQNYDACLLWAMRHPAWTKEGATAVDLRRLAAIAAVNVGLHEPAVERLVEAFAWAGDPTLRAHLAYLIGLIHAKRKQDLRASATWYQRGLQELDTATAADPGDAALERAWIFNGLALNTLLEARFRGRPIRSVFQEVYRRLRDAFDLVREVRTPDRTYLRYNLLGNLGTLMELQREYGLALKLAEETFAPALAAGMANEQEWRAMLDSRRATLHAKCGRLDEARQLFASACDAIEASGCPLRTEILERSVGILDLQLGAWSRARETFARGLERAIELRSRRGALVHARGLVVAHRESGEASAARSVYDRLAEGEGLWLGTPDHPAAEAIARLKVPQRLYGLSLSLPEVDLEDLAKVSVATILRTPAAESVAS